MSLEILLLQRQLRWLGHVNKVPSSCLPSVLYVELIGYRSKGPSEQNVSLQTVTMTHEKRPALLRRFGYFGATI